MKVTCEWYLNALLVEIVLFIKNKEYLVLSYEETQHIEKDLQMYPISLPLLLNIYNNIQFENNSFEFGMVKVEDSIKYMWYNFFFYKKKKTRKEPIFKMVFFRSIIDETSRVLEEDYCETCQMSLTREHIC